MNFSGAVVLVKTDMFFLLLEKIVLFLYMIQQKFTDFYSIFDFLGLLLKNLLYFEENIVFSLSVLYNNLR